MPLIKIPNDAHQRAKASASPASSAPDYFPTQIKKLSRPIIAAANGKAVAGSDNCVSVFEPGDDVVHYFPATDVRLDLLVASNVVSLSETMGLALQFHIVTDRGRIADAVWTYPFPNADFAELRGLFAFDPHKVEQILVGGACGLINPACNND